MSKKSQNHTKTMQSYSHFHAKVSLKRITMAKKRLFLLIFLNGSWKSEILLKNTSPL
jgi:hypothetical protein